VVFFGMIHLSELKYLKNGVFSGRKTVFRENSKRYISDPSLWTLLNNLSNFKS